MSSTNTETKGTHAIEVLTKLDNDKQVATVQSALPAYDRILDLAISQGAPLEQLEKWMDLKMKYEAREAKKAYHKAMAAFKANPPEIQKDRTVGFESKKTGGKTSYSHASLHNVSSLIDKAMSPHGLSKTWKTEQGDGGITVTCTITHELGHSESNQLTAGADNTGNKNSIQAIGSTISYLERYTLLALTGLATKDMDDDGNAAGVVQYLEGDALAHIADLHKQLYNNPNDPKFFKFAGSTGWNDIPAENENKILEMLNERKVAQAKVREPGEEG
jgi:hypothetical protein